MDYVPSVSDYSSDSYHEEDSDGIEGGSKVVEPHIRWPVASTSHRGLIEG